LARGRTRRCTLASSAWKSAGGGRSPASPPTRPSAPSSREPSSAARGDSFTPTWPLVKRLAAGEGAEPLRGWATGLEAPPDYRWWEVAAGASSSAAAHALIAAAADPDTTGATASLVDAAYHPPVGALTVFLDDLVDRDEDRASGEHSYLAYYESSEAAADRLALIASRAEASLGRLPRSARHRAILAGVAGYYLSATAAETPYGQPIRERLLAALGPGARLLAAFMRLRRLGERKRPGQAGNSPGP